MRNKSGKKVNVWKRNAVLLSIVLCVQLSFSVFGQRSIEKGFEELQNKNFGLANEYFRSGLKKSGSIASFGLSKLFITKDFRNFDSAYFYALKSKALWTYTPEKVKLAWKSDFSFDESTIELQQQVLSQLVFDQIKSNPTIASWNHFIANHPWYKSLNTAVYLRDQLAFQTAKNKKTSQALVFFMDTLPESAFVQEAQFLYFDLEYAEITADGQLSSFVQFYEKCPKNPHLSEAAKEIYRLSTLNHSLQEYVQFARGFPANPYVNDAWRYVYQLYFKENSAEKYTTFQTEFPDYPFMQELAVDIDLFQMELFPVLKNGKWGYMNLKGGLMVPAEYDDAGPFQDGLAVVSKEDLFGIIDKKNQRIVDFQYNEILEFVNNLAIVKKEDLYGVINRAGKLIFPLIYEDISIAKNDVYETLKEGETHYFRGDYSPVLYTEEELPLTFSEKMASVHPEFEVIGELDRASNRAVVKVAGQLNYIDSTGKLMLVTAMEWFSDAANLASYQGAYAVFRKKEKYGLMDITGKMVQKNVYEASGPFTGYWPVRDKGNWALLDVKGKVILPFEYSFIRYFDDLGYLIEKGGLFGLLNSSAKMLLPVSFATIKNFDTQYFLVSLNEKYGLYSKEGKEVLPLQYDRIQRYDSETLVLFQGGKVTYYFPKAHSFLSLIE